MMFDNEKTYSALIFNGYLEAKKKSSKQKILKQKI